ncbi:MAG: glycosyltransferase involved in cell wall biosynthesis [Alteromonadaceae bacterium]|jgi:glycosyltransferase involved in cell wall biosynthesis
MFVKQRVLVFSHELPPQGGGAGVVGLQYCSELVESGFDVTVLTKKQSKYPIFLSSIKVIGVRYIPKIYLLPYYLKLRCIDLSIYDHIVLNDMVSVYVAGFCFSEKELKKSISVLHGSEPEMVYLSPDIFQRLTGLTYFYNKAIQGARKIVAVSSYMKNKFLKETPFDNSGKIRIHYSKLGHDFYPMPSDPRVNKALRNEQILLSVSRIEKGKGFLQMYKIFKKLISINSSYKWIIIGDGGFKQEFETLVKFENLDSKIEFKDKMDRERLIKYYFIADVFWLLSEYKESFGLVYLEAQACLCPAIGYNKYGVRETINSGKTGFLVNSAEECLDVLLNQGYKALDKSDFSSFIKSMHSSTIDGILND